MKFIFFFQNKRLHFNPLSTNFTKWSNTLKQFVGKLPTNCLGVFDHFVGSALKGLRMFPELWIFLCCGNTSHTFIRKFSQCLASSRSFIVFKDCINHFHIFNPSAEGLLYDAICSCNFTRRYPLFQLFKNFTFLNNTFTI